MLALAEMTNIAQISPSELRRVEIVAFRDAQILDIAGPLQVFVSANEFLAKSAAGLRYRPVVVAAPGGAMTSAGVAFDAQPLPGPDLGVDTLILSGGSGVDDAASNANLVAWVVQRADAARRVVSICTGAFLLAEAGLLDGRRATTHWARADELRRKFPAVTVDSDPIFVEDGKVWTSAGVTAGIDLCLELVERDCGRDIALSIARDLVLFLKRPGSQAQFSETLALQSSKRFAGLHAWMKENLAGDLSVPALAARAGMSERTFLRHYVGDEGRTPAKAVEAMRIAAARRLLSETALPLKAVAARSGFASEAVFRRAFERVVALTPGDYRRTWSARS